MTKYVVILSGDVPDEDATDGDAVIAWLRDFGAVDDVGTLASMDGVTIKNDQEVSQ